MKKLFSKKIIFAILGIIGIVGIVAITRNRSLASSSTTPNEQPTGAPPIESQVNKEFTFVGTTLQGRNGEDIKMIITKAEKNKQVLIQGQPANAKGDKTFLILNLELENADTEVLTLSPVNLIRLVGEGEKKFAPDVHSNIVDIQPISTKITRVGFVVNESQNNFTLQVGEVEGDKETIEVQF